MVIKRLYRRVKWLLLCNWKTLSLKKWPYESCCYCGKAFRLVWSVDDDCWNDVVGNSDAILCVDCFLEWAKDKNIVIKDDNIRMRIFQP
jgi:hypothetical protein